jgi:hypothetical protein
MAGSKRAFERGESNMAVWEDVVGREGVDMGGWSTGKANGGGVGEGGGGGGVVGSGREWEGVVGSGREW